MSGRMLQTTKFVNALAPDADRFASDPATDVISMSNAKFCTFVLQTGAGTSGTATLTAEACDDIVPTSTTAIPFRYKIMTSATANLEGDTTNATASGFTTTAGSRHMYMVEVEDSDLVSDRKYVRLQLTEVGTGPQDAGVGAFLTGLNDAGNDIATALT